MGSADFYFFSASLSVFNKGVIIKYIWFIFVLVVIASITTFSEWVKKIIELMIYIILRRIRSQRLIGPTSSNCQDNGWTGIICNTTHSSISMTRGVDLDLGPEFRPSRNHQNLAALYYFGFFFFYTKMAINFLGFFVWRSNLNYYWKWTKL